jgi:hypothetical protein
MAGDSGNLRYQTCARAKARIIFTILIGAVIVTTTRDLTRATAAWAAVVQMHYFINV